MKKGIFLLLILMGACSLDQASKQSSVTTTDLKSDYKKTYIGYDKKSDAMTSLPKEIAEAVIVINGLERRYLWSEPNDSSGLAPVIIAFHGYGGLAQDFLITTQLYEAARSAGFYLVYPQGAILASEGFSHWNAGLPSANNKSNIDDFSFFITLVERLTSLYPIDPNRIFLVGYSNGGFLAYALACFYSEKVNAIAAISSSMLDETYQECKPSNKVGIFSLQGAKDSTIAISGSEGVKSFNNVIDFWFTINGGERIEKTQLDGDLIFTQFNQDNATLSEHYEVRSAGHEWITLDLNGESTAELILSYFKQR